MGSIFKEYRLVVIIVIVAALIGLIAVFSQDKLVTVYPQQFVMLTDDDFRLATSQGIVNVGQSNWDEVTALYPEGKALGMSTIFSPNDLDCLFTFTKHENILHRVHIQTPNISTSRGSKVGDAFENVIALYGQNYAYVYSRGHRDDFDAVYGSDNNRSIIFQVRGNKVTKIILQNDPIKR